LVFFFEVTNRASEQPVVSTWFHAVQGILDSEFGPSCVQEVRKRGTPSLLLAVVDQLLFSSCPSTVSKRIHDTLEFTDSLSR
jgi:hypothetical protein